MTKQATYVQRDDGLDFTATADIAVGDVVPIGTKRVGIALTNIANGYSGVLKVWGIWDTVKNAGEAFAIGDSIYWDPIAKKCTKVTTSNIPLGTASTVALAADSIARIWLNI